MHALNKMVIGCGGHARAVISVLLESSSKRTIELVENQYDYNSEENGLT